MPRCFVHLRDGTDETLDQEGIETPPVVSHVRTCGETMEEIPPILVSEDEPLVRLCIVDALEEDGHVVVEAADGHAALGEIDRHECLGGLVTDVRMGASPDGWQVARHAREKFASLAVIYVTGDSVTGWAANGVPQSAVLQKPFANAELVATLAELLSAG